MFIDTMLDSTSQLSRYWLLGIGTVLMDSSTIIWKVYQNVPLIATYLFEIGLFTCNAKIPMRNVWNHLNNQVIFNQATHSRNLYKYKKLPVFSLLFLFENHVILEVPIL